MTNTELLRESIEYSGYKRTYIAHKIGLTYQGYLKKERGESEFKQSEIEELCKLLHLTLEEKEKIFFANQVDKTSTA